MTKDEGLNGHGIIKCEGCKKVIAQCRCIEGHKYIRWIWCTECQIHDEKICPESKGNEEVVEKLAEYCHDVQWTGWMKHLFSKGFIENKGREHEGCFIIPQSWYERWDYQTKTKYKDLPADMKESDRKEAQAICRKFNLPRRVSKGEIGKVIYNSYYYIRKRFADVGDNEEWFNELAESIHRLIYGEG